MPVARTPVWRRERSTWVVSLRRRTVLLAVIGLVASWGLVAGPAQAATPAAQARVADGVLSNGNPAGPPVVPGNVKANCLYPGGNPWQPTLQSAEQITGIHFRCMLAYNNEGADPTWADWYTPWLIQPQYGFDTFAQTPGNQLIYTMDLIPSGLEDLSNPLTWEQPCASGAYDQYAVRLARTLVSNGMGDAVIRLGDEMNGDWEVDFIGSFANGADSVTPQEESDWAGCFAQEVRSMRTVPGAHFLFDWNPNACVDNFPLASYYPGNAYVDLIGVDQYDAFCDGAHPAPSAATFAELYNEPSDSGGVDYASMAAITAFAEAHHKPMSLPEWGTIATSSGGLGDDGYYVAGIGRWVATHDVAFQCYFDDGDDGVLQLGPPAPSMTQAYRAAFAARP